jgi:hypothetical protein
LKTTVLSSRILRIFLIGPLIFSCFPACTRNIGFDAKLLNLELTSLGSSNTELPSLFPKSAVHIVDEKFFATLPQGVEARKSLCAIPIPMDGVANVFCQPTPPRVTNLSELQIAVGLGFKDVGPAAQNGLNGNPGFALTAHSNSLVLRGVTTLNPRAILFTPGVTSPSSPYVSLAFTRGEQFAEIIAKDMTTGNLTFYVVKFSQSCNSNNSCSTGDLVTPAVEKNWTGFDVYRDETHFKNTVFDCRHCHQPNAANPARLGMREVQAPFTHYFSDLSIGGRALVSDFQEAHGTDEDYAGIPGQLIAKSDPSLLQKFVTAAGFGLNLPNPYPSEVVEQEVEVSSPMQPESNQTSGISATWNSLFTTFLKTGLSPPPFHDVKATDPVKLSSMIGAYREFKEGRMPASKLPDIRETFPDDPLLLSKMGLRAQPGLDAQSLLINACLQCHTSQLDLTIGRARFSVDRLSLMSRTEKDIAILKINQPADSLSLMPPSRYRSLTEAEKKLLTDFLKQ